MVSQGKPGSVCCSTNRPCHHPSFLPFPISLPLKYHCQVPPGVEHVSILWPRYRGDGECGGGAGGETHASSSSSMLQSVEKCRSRSRPFGPAVCAVNDADAVNGQAMLLPLHNDRTNERPTDRCASTCTSLMAASGVSERSVVRSVAGCCFALLVRWRLGLAEPTQTQALGPLSPWAHAPTLDTLSVAIGG